MISTDEDGDYIYIHLPTLRPSSYAIGYNFRTPLPSFEEAETETEEPEKDNDPSKQAMQTEVTFSASVGGRLQTPMQDAKFVYEDGTEEVKRVCDLSLQMGNGH
jgi:DnaJ family protein C protein 11